MADFVAVLRKTIGGLGENTPEIRDKVYQKARNTIEAKLAALNPPPPAAAADRQRQALEDAIRTIEAEYAPVEPEASDPLNELDELFHELATTKPSDRAHEGDAEAAAAADEGLVEHKPWFKPVPDEEPADPVEEPVEDVSDEEAIADPRAADEVSGADEVSTADEDVVVADDHMPSAHDEAALTDIAADPHPSSSPTHAEDTHADDADVPRRSRTGLIVAGLVLLLAAAGGYAAWLNKDGINAFVASLQDPGAPVDVAPAGDDATADDATADGAPQSDVPAGNATEGEAQSGTQPQSAPPATPATPQESAPATDGQEDGAANEGPEKFTQRLMPDGSEVDEGPSGSPATIGEGTSVAASTPGESPQSPEAAEAVPVGQKAIFYEERTSVAEGSAETGSVVWSLVQESPGGDLPPEPAIRAEATIPGRDLQLRMTIRRNGDESLPASHIVELIFLAPEGFGDGGVDNVLRMTMKGTEEATGNPLLGIPAKIADGFFLIALNDGAPEIEANTTLMRRENWIDIPVVYKSGRRALFTMEKGIPGDKVFDEALKAWQSASSG